MCKIIIDISTHGSSLRCSQVLFSASLQISVFDFNHFLFTGFLIWHVFQRCFLSNFLQIFFIGFFTGIFRGVV